MRQIPEQKQWDSVLDFSAATAPMLTWQWKSFLTPIVQGGGANTADVRIGNKIFVKGITIRVVTEAVFPVVSLHDGFVCRCVVYHNKTANQAVPQTLEIFNTDAYSSLRKSSFMPKYKLLRDHFTFTSPAGTNGATIVAYTPDVIHDYYIPVNKIISYVSTVGSAADLLKDDIGFGCASNQPSSACAMKVYYKVSFMDN